MVHPVHQKNIGRYVQAFKVPLVNIQQKMRQLALCGNMLSVIVPIFQVNGKAFRAVRPLPFKFGRKFFLAAHAVFPLVNAETAPEHKGFQPEIL